MGFKNILVVTSGAAGNSARIKEAVAIAAHHGATIVALHVKPTPNLTAARLSDALPAGTIEDYRRRMDNEAFAIEMAAKAQAARAHIPLEWHCEEGDEIERASTHASYCDLAIAAPSLARNLVFAAASPVLAFPEHATAGLPKRVLVAWNGSREANRALRDALPLISAASTVDVVSVDPPRDGLAATCVGRTLAHSSAKIRIRSRSSHEQNPGTLLLEEAAASHSDLLVMGAYGHSRIRKWVLGGVTEAILTNCTIPVLLSH